jgi:pseudaminic acid synthase
MKINSRNIGVDYSPYVIAEMSANHNGNINNALKIIEMAKVNGADAVKLQTYRPDTITLDMRTPQFMIEDGLWEGQSLYSLYESAYMPWDWHKPLFDHAKKLDISIFSSPFDRTAVDLLEDLNAPAYKIASFEAVDLPLIKYTAETGKPLIISTGMADAAEIQEAIQAARDGGCVELAILHCVSGYPAPPEDYNLKTLLDMQSQFGIPVGLSDHTIDNAIAIASVSLGACIIEKHVTMDRNGGGPDDSFSLEPNEFKSLCSNVRTAWQSLGAVDYGRKSSEKGNVKFRRSLYFVNSLSKGAVIGPADIRSVRPGYGLSPKFSHKIVGLKVNRDVDYGQAVRQEDIDGVLENMSKKF